MHEKPASQRPEWPDPTGAHLRPVPLQTLPVYLARDFSVTDGANLGDTLGDAEELVLDDVYELCQTASRVALPIADSGRGPFVIVESGAKTTTRGATRAASKEPVGTPGNLLHLDCTLSFMAAHGPVIEALVLAEVNRETDKLEQVFLLPLAPLTAGTAYRLIGVDHLTTATRFAEIACVSFTRGTRITLSDGHQRRVEDLRVGDLVLTRDQGPQTIRWIGETTQRAEGEFAPIVISKGVLNNENDLIVSPNHRLFIYQRLDALNAGRAELLVKARHLVNGVNVVQRAGGFVDYFQLLFDSHQIIYAEGIAAESLLLDRRTIPALPEEVTQALHEGSADAPAHSSPDIEVAKELLQAPDTVERLRRASSG